MIDRIMGKDVARFYDRLIWNQDNIIICKNSYNLHNIFNVWNKGDYVLYPDLIFCNENCGNRLLPTVPYYETIRSFLMSIPF